MCLIINQNHHNNYGLCGGLTQGNYYRILEVTDSLLIYFKIKTRNHTSSKFKPVLQYYKLFKSLMM